MRTHTYERFDNQSGWITTNRKKNNAQGENFGTGQKKNEMLSENASRKGKENIVTFEWCKTCNPTQNRQDKEAIRFSLFILVLFFFL